MLRIVNLSTWAVKRRIARKSRADCLLIAGGFTESFALMVFYSTQLGVRQALTPARLQGRMTGSMRFLIQALVPVGSIVGGTLGSTIGLRSTLWVGAIGSLSGVVPILLSRIPAIRAIPEQAEP